MKPKLKEKSIVQELRRQGLSYNEILQRVSVAKSSISSWCQDIELTSKQRERLIEKEREHQKKLAKIGPRAMALKRQKQVSRIKEIAKKEIHRPSFYEFKVAGAMLFWAEGSKTRGKGVEITNSDPELIKFMVKWLREVCGVSTRGLSARLNIHINQNEKRIKNYWSELTGIPLKNFGKSYIKSEGTGQRKNILHNGVIRIRIGDEDLRQKIMAWINVFHSRQV